jgi:hypothetical protein
MQLWVLTIKAVPLHAMKAPVGRGGIDPTHSRPRHLMGWVVSVTPRPPFSPGERTPGTHWTGDWVGPRAGMNTEATGKILSPLPGIKPKSPSRPARSQTPYWLGYPARVLTVLHIISQQYLFVLEICAGTSFRIVWCNDSHPVHCFCRGLFAVIRPKPVAAWRILLPLQLIMLIRLHKSKQATNNWPLGNISSSCVSRVSKLRTSGAVLLGSWTVYHTKEITWLRY